MKVLKGDLLSSKHRISPHPHHETHRDESRLYAPVLFLVIFVLSFAVGRISLSETASIALAELEGIPIFGQMSHLIRSPDRMLTGESDDRINVLLLGMGGEGHDGPYLTDTIIVASLKPSDNQVALLSIPRDLIAPLPDYGWRKINAANAFGEINNRGRGGDSTREVLQSLLGIDIPYYVRIDFAGFKQIVDSINGVDIYVERAFTDRQYPTDDHLTQVISFEQGWQRMDGETALQYARSRHGTNGEGSDFARAKRQQKVITSVKGKMLSLKTYRNPAVIADTLSSLQANIATNLKLGDILRLVRLGQQLGDIQMSHKVVDNGPDSPLVASIVNGAYVLVPKNGDWNELRKVAVDVFDSEGVGAVTTEPIPEKPDDSAMTTTSGESADIEIQNGSGISGLARETATSLKETGVNILKIGNAESFEHEVTTIYDLSEGSLSVSLAKLKRVLPRAEVAEKVPSTLADNTATNIDFLIILGQDLSTD